MSNTLLHFNASGSLRGWGEETPTQNTEYD